MIHLPDEERHFTVIGFLNRLVAKPRRWRLLRELLLGAAVHSLAAFHGASSIVTLQAVIGRFGLPSGRIGLTVDCACQHAVASAKVANLRALSMSLVQRSSPKPWLASGSAHSRYSPFSGPPSRK